MKGFRRLLLWYARLTKRLARQPAFRILLLCVPLLPAGTALRYLSAAVRGAGGSVSALLLWTLGFLAAAAAVRAWRYGRVGA